MNEEEARASGDYVEPPQPPPQRQIEYTTKALTYQPESEPEPEPDNPFTRKRAVPPRKPGEKFHEPIDYPKGQAV